MLTLRHQRNHNNGSSMQAQQTKVKISYLVVCCIFSNFFEYVSSGQGCDVHIMGESNTVCAGAWEWVLLTAVFIHIGKCYYFLRILTHQLNEAGHQDWVIDRVNSHMVTSIISEILGEHSAYEVCNSMYN